MSGRATSPPLNAVGVLSSSGPLSIDMPRGGRPLVIAKNYPGLLQLRQSAWFLDTAMCPL
jgi:hypothetical protein